MAQAEQFDYVVVGAGSAGCVVAARLSESGLSSVALLEAGGEDDNFWIRLPVGYSKLYDSPEYNWLFQSEPEPGLHDGRSFQPRGKVLGGCGSINGNVYQRGLTEDFEYWAQLGNIGWGPDDVIPHFRKAEDNEKAKQDPLYGSDGPLKVTNLRRDPLSDAFIQAADEAGYRKNGGFNGRNQNGFGYNQVTIAKGRRVSTSSAYLHPARRRSNLNVLTRTTATRILFENGEAKGIEFVRDGITKTILARREVVLCGGVFNSPQLLQVSGVGPGELLAQCNVPLVSHSPGVGENLQDHIGVGMTYQCAKPVTINDIVNNPFRLALSIAEYALFRRGLLTSTPVAAAGLICTDPSHHEPDVKLQLRNWNRSHSGRSKERMGLSPLSSFGVAVHLMHPESRGSVRIKSASAEVPPEIRFNFFLSERDHQSALIGQRINRQIMSMPAMRPFIVKELSPGPDCNSDDELVENFRKRAISGHHATGSCKMGVDELAVVDPRLRVRGVGRLRVVDASIMPRQVAANTNATTIMIGEKGSAMIMEDARQ
ncbi:MAG: GMC family oxidoreductase N-terminal domain-containing protein [Rhizobiaceae bacterium]|nr:GMC family oxidoreductase N-terminal domain-containing protein [Rhizobiaceae bacterium]